MTQSTVTDTLFGHLPNGEPVHRFICTRPNGSGCSVELLTLGATLAAWHIPSDPDTEAHTNIVLGFDSLEGYLADDSFQGRIVGRYANRIAHGRFSLDGTEYTLETNNGPNHLHGGSAGIHAHNWSAEPFETVNACGVTFRTSSPDGDGGYPGAVEIAVTYTLDDDQRLTLRYEATTDRTTLLNLTAHPYFNLAGGGDVLAHELWLNAERMTPIDRDQIPTGEIRPVIGTPFDFTTGQPLGRAIDLPDPQLTFGGGYDHNYVLDTNGDVHALAARLFDPSSGRVLTMKTTEPGVQVYTGNWLTPPFTPRTGICLEAQKYPDSPNRPSFPSAVIHPDRPYHQVTIYQVTRSGT